MNDENKSIHEFDFELICEYFSNLERQGPGSPEVTIKALSFIDNLNDKSLILPENCWTEHFYAPQVNAQKVFLEKNAGNKAAVEFIANQRHETQLYYKYKEYYGYVFYIGKKFVK